MASSSPKPKKETTAQNTSMTLSLSDKRITPFYSYFHGSAYLGDSLELLKFVPDESVNLILTSPPFALTSKKEYGNKASEDYANWFMDFAKEFKRVMTPDGSLVIDSPYAIFRFNPRSGCQHKAPCVSAGLSWQIRRRSYRR